MIMAVGAQDLEPGRQPFTMERHTCLMIFIFIIYGGFSLYAVVTSLYAMTYSLYSVPSPLYVVHVVL